MTTTITDGTTISTPTTVTGYQADREAGNVLHTIVGSAADAVTLRPAGLRAGTMTAVFATYTLAKTLDTMLATAAKFTLADTTFSGIGMNFVMSGTQSLQLDPQSVSAWLVVFDFQEVS